MEIKIHQGYIATALFFLFSSGFFIPALPAEESVPYTWEKCVKAAFANNPDLLSSREKIRQTKAAKGITRSSMLPEVSATFSGEKVDQESSASSSSERYSYGISAKQLIFDGFKSLYDLRGADTDIVTATQDYLITSATVRLNLKNAFISLLKTQEMLKIAEEIRDRRKHVLQLVKMKYDAGSEHRGSYYSAKADYLEAIAGVKSAAREVSLSRMTLCYLMGMDRSADIKISGDLHTMAKYDKPPDFSALTMKNPSYIKAASEAKSALLSMKSSSLAFSPQLYGTASVGKSGETLNDMTGNWSLGFKVSAPLFSGGETWYGYKKAEAVYKQARHDEKTARLEAMKSLEESWNNLMDSIENVEVQKSSLEAYEERSRIGEVQYSIGSLTFDNWTIIENNLASARKSYIEACSTAMTSEAQWINSTGGTLDNEIKR